MNHFSINTLNMITTMHIQLHKNARSTPAIRQEIQNTHKHITNAQLAQKYGLHRHTISKWRKRRSVADLSHQPHHFHANLTAAQEHLVLAIRELLMLPLDDLLAVIHEFINPTVSRSGLARCLRRHKVPSLRTIRIREEKAGSAKHKSFKDYEPGFVHVDLKYLPLMPDETRRKYLFVGIDRATRWVYVEILSDKSASSATAFLTRLIEKAPFRITKLVTDNGKEFTDRFCATGERKPTNNHPFDKVCVQEHIEHRLITPRRPQTNGMVERFNGRIADVLKTTRFDSSKRLEETINHYVMLYNHEIPQKALGHKPPIQAMKTWHEKCPALFRKPVYNLTGHDT